jgi:hypothetical protein
MPLEDKEQILNDIFKKVKESSSTIKSLFSMEKKQQKVSSNVIARQEEKDSEEEVSRDEEKQYRIKTVKLLEEIRDQGGEVGGAGGGGLGGLLGLLGGALGGIGDLLVGSLTKGLGSLVGSMLLALPQLLAVAGVSMGAYKLGNWIYENGIQPWLDPLMEEQAKKAREQLNTTATSAIQATSDKGEKLYTDVKTGKTITEAEATQTAQTAGMTLQQAEESGSISKKITTVNTQTGQAILPGQKTTYSAEDISAMNEPANIAAQQKQRAPETKEDVEKSQVRNVISQLESYKMQMEPILKRMESPQGYRDQKSADNDLNMMSGLIRSLSNFVDNHNAQTDPAHALISTYLKDNPWMYALSTSTRGADLGVTGVQSGPYFSVDYDTAWYKFGFGESQKLKFENNKGIDYSAKEIYKIGEVFAKNAAWLKAEAKQNRSLDEYVDIYRGGWKNADGRIQAKFANEGIIEGTRRGSRIIAGENYTSEAVVSTKPNTVTETIGKNLYDIIKQSANSDISSTQRQSTIITDALKNTIQSYYDMTKISPLNTQGGQTIVNNFVGGMGAGNMPETNAQFNSGGLTVTNTETVLQKVYMDAYKAALL